MEESEDDEVFDLPAASVLDQNIVPVLLLLSLERLVQRDHIGTSEVSLPLDILKTGC